MKEASANLEGMGLDVKPVLGDFSTLEAIEDELRRRPYDEIVISTHPVSRLTRRLKRDLPARVVRTFGIPVHHIEAGNDRQDPGAGIGRPEAA